MDHHQNSYLNQEGRPSAKSKPSSSRSVIKDHQLSNRTSFGSKQDHRPQGTLLLDATQSVNREGNNMLDTLHNGISVSSNSSRNRGLSNSSSSKSLLQIEEEDIEQGESPQNDIQRSSENNIIKEESFALRSQTKRLTLIPAALPLISTPAQPSLLEPELRFKVNRMMIKNPRANTTMDLSSFTKNQAKRNNCKHLTVKSHLCQVCGSSLVSFKGSLFETQHGAVATVLNIKYVNEYFEQYASQSQEQHLVIKATHKLVYECYKPRNTNEMREYILYQVDRSLQKVRKNGLFNKEYERILGMPGNGAGFSQELMTYKIISKNRENVVLGKPLIKQYQDVIPQQEYSLLMAGYQNIGSECLIFDSFFEGGNLERAEYISASEYNLYLNVDTNTKGHQQWFYFRVKNTQANKRITFTIRNFTKPFSLHKQGMRVFYKSQKKNESDVSDMSGNEVEGDFWDKGWAPLEEEAVYARSQIARSGWRIPGPLNMDDEEDEDQGLDDLHDIEGTGGARVKKTLSNTQQPAGTGKRRRRYFYTLTFTHQFKYDEDEVYFAYSTPYNYSRIFLQMLAFEQQIISASAKSDLKITESPDRSDRSIITKEISYQRAFVGRSLSGLPIPVITISSRRHIGVDFKKRQGISISARVHPGETNSNFVYDGLLKFLLSTEGINSLLKTYVIKLFPVINADGVVCGNYRSSLAGVDLNRQWALPSATIHPEVYNIKSHMSRFSKERQLLVFCDLHCHSKKVNSFIYGCNTAAKGGFTTWTQTRLLPRILAKLTPLFNFQDCRFRIDPEKVGTARVIVWKELGVTNSFTLESSFFGYLRGTNIVSFDPSAYSLIGESLMRALIEYRVCIKQIEKELIETKGWLKPKLLLEVTGTPAAQKIAEELADKAKKELKMKKIEEYKQQMAIKQEPGVKGSGVTGSATKQAQKPGATNQGSKIAGGGTLREGSGSGQQQSQEKTRNMPGGETINTKTDQFENRFEVRRKSSSDSTNDLSSRYRFQQAVQRSQGVDGIQTPRKEGRPKLISERVRLTVKKTTSNIRGGFGNSLNNSKADFTTSNQKSFRAKDGNKSQQGTRKNSAVRKSDSEEGASTKGSVFGGQGADWRNYFLGEELEKIYEQIEEGDDPNDLEAEISCSDDNASDDNFDQQELYNDIYLREDLIFPAEMEAVKEVEENLKKQIMEDNQELKKKGSEARLIKKAQRLKEIESEREKMGRIENFNEILVCDQDQNFPGDQAGDKTKKAAGGSHSKRYSHIRQDSNVPVIKPENITRRPISQSIRSPTNRNQGDTFDSQQIPQLVQQVFETCEGPGDIQTHQSLVGQQNANGKQNQKMNSTFRKTFYDPQIGSRPIQGKSINGGVLSQYQQKSYLNQYQKQNAQQQSAQQPSNQMGTPQQPQPSPKVRQFHSFVNPADAHSLQVQLDATRKMALPSVAPVKPTGFQQYLLNNLKNENSNVKQAYSKMNGKERAPQGDGTVGKGDGASVSGFTSVHQSFDQHHQTFQGGSSHGVRAEYFSPQFYRSGIDNFTTSAKDAQHYPVKKSHQSSFSASYGIGINGQLVEDNGQSPVIEENRKKYSFFQSNSPQQYQVMRSGAGPQIKRSIALQQSSHIPASQSPFINIKESEQLRQEIYYHPNGSRSFKLPTPADHQIYPHTYQTQESQIGSGVGERGMLQLKFAQQTQQLSQQTKLQNAGYHLQLLRKEANNSTMTETGALILVNNPTNLVQGSHPQQAQFQISPPLTSMSHFSIAQSQAPPIHYQKSDIVQMASPSVGGGNGGASFSGPAAVAQVNHKRRTTIGWNPKKSLEYTSNHHPTANQHSFTVTKKKEKKGMGRSDNESDFEFSGLSILSSGAMAPPQPLRSSNAKQF